MSGFIVGMLCVVALLLAVVLVELCSIEATMSLILRRLREVWG